MSSGFERDASPIGAPENSPGREPWEQIGAQRHSSLPQADAEGWGPQRHAKADGTGIVRVVLVLILLAGACLTARAAYLHAKAALAGVLIRDAWEATLRTGQPHRPWPWADTHPVARLRIPRLAYDEIVLEGATLRTLAFGPAHLRSGAAFGEPGNVVLAGHRTNWFRGLEGVRAGDHVELEWYDSRRGGLRTKSYIIEELRVVTAADLALLAPTNRDALTLVTCYPFGRGPTSPQRFIVRAAPAAASSVTQRPAQRQTAGWPLLLFIVDLL